MTLRDDELHERLIGDGAKTVHPSQLRAIIRRTRLFVENRVDRLERRIATGGEAVATVAGRVAAVESSALRIDVVASVDALPASAPPRQWFRVANDPAVYVGDGAGRPLTRLVPLT